MLVYFNKLEYYWKIQNWFVKRNKNGTVAHLVVQLMFEDSHAIGTCKQLHKCTIAVHLLSWKAFSLCLHLTWYT